MAFILLLASLAAGSSELPSAIAGAFDATPAPVCGPGAMARRVSIVSLPLPIAYNRWGDLDPHGALFVETANVLPLLRETANSLTAALLPELAGPLDLAANALERYDVPSALAALASLDSAVARLADGGTGARGRVQPVALAHPIILRAELGECLRIDLLNLLPQPIGIDVLGLAIGGDAGTPRLTLPGGTRAYHAGIPDAPATEGAHILQPAGPARDLIRRGLFGAVVVEPRGASWAPAGPGGVTGAEAIIDMPPGRSDFREFVLLYHDEVELWNSVTMRALPILDAYGGYGPGTKAINLRAEPFMDRFQAHDASFANATTPTAHDKSQAYSSYAYGDPGVFIPRSYVGEPTKFRLANVGPGQPHVHHLHGGGIRWRATPLADDTQFDEGLVKDPGSRVRPTSDRLDVVTLGPGQATSAEPEGGAGGVQQTVGDLLYHCHIVEHYIAGMWSFWRVLDTRQPDLDELPDRRGRIPLAVDSTGLVGRTMPDGTVLDATAIEAWAKRVLPARGVPGPGDASVWDWSVQASPTGPLVLGEPETDARWPNYESPTPGLRPAVMFHPETGRPAFPLLRPHLGERPPFARAHGPAPYLTPDASAHTPDGVCPASAPRVRHDLVATQVVLPLNEFDRDERGQVFVRAADLDSVISGATSPRSLVLRANTGDCLDVTLTSRLAERADDDLQQGVVSKVNVHIHLVQFDIQGSDGVIVGFNFEQSVRSVEGATRSGLPVVATVSTTTAAPRVIDGRTTLAVADVAPFLDSLGAPKNGAWVGVGLASAHVEQLELVGVDAAASTIVLNGTLEHTPASGAHVGFEFVNYRWYPDVELGVVYFHDHVDGLTSWMHGLYGSLIVEPAGTRWVDPKRSTLDDAAPLATTLHVVDVIDPTASADRTRNFREIVLQVFDRGCVGTPAQCTGASEFPLPAARTTEPAGFNTRSAPLWRRNAALPLSSNATYKIDDPRTPVDERTLAHGDPDPLQMLEAHAGDAIVIRLVYTGQSTSAGVGTFGVGGHRLGAEQWNAGARPIDTISLGISSQHNLVVECGAGGCVHGTGDYPFWMTNSRMLDRGAWGIIRVHAAGEGGALRPLPGTGSAAPAPASVGTPDRSYDVVATNADLVTDATTGASRAISVFALAQTPRPLAAEDVRPLVLRANAGETVRINVTNLLSIPVTFHAGLVSGEPEELGLPVGRNAEARVMPGATRAYTFVADRDVGVAHVSSMAQPVSDPARGLYGALVVEPEGAMFSAAAGSSATLVLADGRRVAEHVLVYQDADAQFETSTMPYASSVAAPALINFRSAPLRDRVGPVEAGGCDVDPNFCGDQHGGVRARVRNPLLPLHGLMGDPATPVVLASRGDPIVLRVLGGAGDQLQTHVLQGHAWAVDWTMQDCRFDHAACRSAMTSAATIGPREAVNVWIPAAGPGGSGDFAYGTGRAPFAEAGAWGILRVASDGEGAS